MYRTRVLKTAALLTALVQFVLGIGYLAAPRGFHSALGLQGLPAWAAWPLGLLGARCLAFGFGMLLVWRDPYAHRGWIQAMILVQGLDWAVVLIHLGTGTLQFSQVATAPFLPPLLMAAFLLAYPRQNPAVL